MKTKKIAASLLLLLSTSAYSMDTAFFAEGQGTHCASAQSIHACAFSPLQRFLNDDFVSNLRFLLGQKQWNPAFSGHPQSILKENFPIDPMTQLVQLLFPSPTGDYLVANQSTDIIALTKPSKFFEALSGMRQGSCRDAWALFEILFDRCLSPSAKEIIREENNNFSIAQFANAIIKLAAQHRVQTDGVMTCLQYLGVFQDEFLDSTNGNLLRSSLAPENLVTNKIFNILPDAIKKLKFEKKALEKTLSTLKTVRTLEKAEEQKEIKKSIKEIKKSITEISEKLVELNALNKPKSEDVKFSPKSDFPGYQIANAFMDAFTQEQDRTYSPGTLDRIIATYMWQKAKTVADLPFLQTHPVRTIRTKRFFVLEVSPIIPPQIIPHEVMKKHIRPLIDNPGLLRPYYDEGHYDVIWAYIYRERLMLDAKHVPIIKYRTTTVDDHSIPDCFETAMRNFADYVCFKDGSFDPTVWKEGSLLREYFTEFGHTHPNDPRARSKWAALVAKRDGVLYYTPSKKLNDPGNTVEAVPGIINMLKIMAHLGDATAETCADIGGLDGLSETGAHEQLDASFQRLMCDLTDGAAGFDSVHCSAEIISDRIAGFHDFTGTLTATVANRLPFEWSFTTMHSIFKCDAPTQAHDEQDAQILSDLQLFTGLKSHYTDLKTLITPEMPHRELKELLMTSDLRSPDLRRKIMPVLLESHFGLPLVKNILRQAEKEYDTHEVKEILRIFNTNINAWLDDEEKQPIAMDLIRSTPKLFTQSICEHDALYRSLIARFEKKTDTGAGVLATDARDLAIELMQKVSDLDLTNGGHDPILPYLSNFTNITRITNFSISNRDGTLNRSAFSQLSDFKKLSHLGFYCSTFKKLSHLGFYCSTYKTPAPDDSASDLPFDAIIGQLPASLQSVSIYNLSDVNWDDFELFIEKLAELRPALKIDMPGSMTILASHPRTMALVTARRIMEN